MLRHLRKWLVRSSISGSCICYIPPLCLTPKNARFLNMVRFGREEQRTSLSVSGLMNDKSRDRGKESFELQEDYGHAREKVCIFAKQASAVNFI